ncbi:MAG: decarboxylase [Croceitalea sp.]|nr:acetolactate decarboxylase [Croceitalea sp.]MBT8237409.1 acetolactate decarboxylase [Croceitalea sp.]NNM17457.1 decarboxylase [Croceitalea sp.]
MDGSLKQILAMVSLIFLMVSCIPKTQDAQVKYAGALSTMLSGNLEAMAALDSLSKKKNLYALGAFENLKGEIQIFNGKAFNTSITSEKVVFDITFDKKAALVVYAQVANWQNVEIPLEIDSSIKLQGFIEEQAEALGINTEKPIPFLIEGNVETLNWHIVNWKDGDTVHTHQKHKESGLNGVEENREVDIIGFFSKSHKAVFTHHSTFLHMHFKTDDNEVAGHIDDLEMGTKMILKLPAK